jgi:PqqD family protein of HPr-rel-A system
MSTHFVATAGLEAAPLADGAVLYHPKTGKFVMLNRSADRLWSELSKPKTEDELVRGLRRTYPDIETPAARDAVSQALESLRRLDLVLAQPGKGDVDRPTSAAEGGGGGHDRRTDYAPPSVTVLGEEDLLKVFQMTAAEISVALCWWGACTSGCP